MTAEAPSPRPGMGAVPFDGGTTFRVWAPHADAVVVTGEFDGWSAQTELARDGDARGGTWSGDVPGARPGQEYRFLLRTPEGDLWRLDPVRTPGHQFRRERGDLRP